MCNSATVLAWQDKLNLIDPFFGDQKALDLLVKEAPTPELAAWLASQIEENRKFQVALLGNGSH